MEENIIFTTQLTQVNKIGCHYMIQLDALRALTVFGVMVHHFFPETLFINSALAVGPMRVKLFFVMSGFLITGILLRSGDTVDSTVKKDT